jgi:hypothetical protein
MQEQNRRVFRFLVVLGLGASLAIMAGQAVHPEKPGMRGKKKLPPEPIIWVTVIESTVPEQCLLAPRDSGRSAKRKVIACG